MQIMVSLTPLPDTGEISNGSNFNFQICGQILINKNCLNPRTSNDTDMKHWKSGKTVQEKYDDGNKV